MKGAPKQPDLGVETLDLHSEGEGKSRDQLHMLQRGEKQSKAVGGYLSAFWGVPLRLMLGIPG